MDSYLVYSGGNKRQAGQFDKSLSGRKFGIRLGKSAQTLYNSVISSFDSLLKTRYS